MILVCEVVEAGVPGFDAVLDMVYTVFRRLLAGCCCTFAQTLLVRSTCCPVTRDGALSDVQCNTSIIAAQ